MFLSQLLDNLHLPQCGGCTWQHKMAVLTGGLVGVASIWYLWKRYDNRNLPPGPTGWPIVGCKHLLDGDKFESGLAELGKKYGDVFSIQNGPKLLIILNSNSAIKEAFVEQKEVFSSRPDCGIIINCMQMQDDLDSIHYGTPGWNENKALLLSCLRSTAFGPTREIENKILEQVQLLLPYLHDFSEKGAPLDFGDILPKATVNVIFQILMSRKYEYNDPNLDEMVKIVHNWLWAFLDARKLDNVPTFLLKLMYRKTMKSIFERTEAVRNIVRTEIKYHMATLDPDDPRDFIDVYLTKTGGQHSMPRMVDNIMLFLPDASDTLVVTLSLVFLYVTHHQDVQKRISDEIIALTGGNRCVTWADKVKLPYTDAVILEILRVEPPFPFSAPHAVSKEVLFRGYRIPPRAMIQANIRAAQRDPKTFVDPEQFKPERFLDKEGQLIQIDGWMPFSMGRRKCIGEQMARMELFLFTANLVQGYHITFPESHVPSLDCVRDVSSVPPPYTVMLNKRVTMQI